MVLNGFKYFYLILVLCIIGATVSLFKMVGPEEEYKLKEMGGKPNSPYSLQMYTSIEKYSKLYKVPKHVAYNVAYRETRYKGPFDWNYHGKLISSAGAKGPMQVMPSTANYISGKKISQKDLLHNIDLNVQISLKLLSKLHKQYKDWAVICGYYNTGLPIINDYAKFCAFNKDYKKNWVKY